MLSSFLTFIKKIFIVALCIVSLVFGALFAFENPDKITPIVYGNTLPSLSLGVYLVGAFIIGVFLGSIISAWGAQTRLIKLKHGHRRLTKKVGTLSEDKRKLELTVNGAKQGVHSEPSIQASPASTN